MNSNEWLTCWERVLPWVCLVDILHWAQTCRRAHRSIKERRELCQLIESKFCYEYWHPGGCSIEVLGRSMALGWLLPCLNTTMPPEEPTFICSTLHRTPLDEMRCFIGRLRELVLIRPVANHCACRAEKRLKELRHSIYGQLKLRLWKITGQGQQQQGRKRVREWELAQGYGKYGSYSGYGRRGPVSKLQRLVASRREWAQFRRCGRITPRPNGGERRACSSGYYCWDRWYPRSMGESDDESDG